MKTTIDSSRGVVTYRDGSGFFIEGLNVEEAAHNNKWIHLRSELHDGSGASALTYEAYRDTAYNMRFFRHNQNDKIFVEYQMPHTWNGGDVIARMHCVPMASGSGDVYFEYEYTWSIIGKEFMDSTGWTSGSLSASYTPADRYIHKTINFVVMSPPAGATVGSSLFFAINRRGDLVQDTYSGSKSSGTPAANLGIIYLNCQLQVSGAGTANP